MMKKLNSEFTDMMISHYGFETLSRLKRLGDLEKKPCEMQLVFALKYELGYDKNILCDYRLALLHYKEASKLGNGFASLKAALFYLYGRGCECPDYEKFKEYIHLSIKQGNKDACRYLNVVDEKFFVKKDNLKFFIPKQRKTDF